MKSQENFLRPHSKIPEIKKEGINAQIKGMCKKLLAKQDINRLKYSIREMISVVEWDFLSKKFRWKNSAERKVFELLRRKLGQEVTMEEVQSCGVAKETTSRTIESIARKLEIYNLEKNPVFKFTLERKRSIKDGRKLIAKLSCSYLLDKMMLDAND